MDNSDENQPLHDYYGPLLTQHVRTILESGLLLDEDYEVLLKESNFKMYPVKATKLPLGLIASAVTTLGSVFVAKRYDVPFVVLPSVTVTLCLFYLERKSITKFRRYKEIINYLVQSLTKMQKLNTTIIRYTKLRKELGSTKEKDILLYNQNFEAFMKFFLKKYEKYFKSCLENLRLLTNLTNELSDDFKGLTQIDFETLLICDYSTIDDYLSITSRVQDVYVFLSSKLLNYLALTFSKNLRNLNELELEYLLDKLLPSNNAILNNLYDEVHKEFNNFRYCTSKKVEIHTKNKTSFTRHVSGKLQQTLISAVNNLSIIMEKSQAVLNKVESAENEKDVKNIESALSDLRDHAFATYESLDVLCKLYCIFSEANKTEDAVKFVASTKKNIDLKQDVSTCNYDDPTVTLEENYELFIPKNGSSVTVEEKDPYVDQSGVYLNLMLKELRQSLKQHERFVAARDKRGIKDEDEESSETNKYEKLRLIPKFDLRALQTEELVLEKADNEVLNLPPVPPPRLYKLPPPLPPPPPSFNLSSFDEGDVNISNKSLLENIRTLSSQVQGKEDVFGSNDC